MPSKDTFLSRLFGFLQQEFANNEDLNAKKWTFAQGKFAITVRGPSHSFLSPKIVMKIIQGPKRYWVKIELGPKGTKEDILLVSGLVHKFAAHARIY